MPKQVTVADISLGRPGLDQQGPLDSGHLLQYRRRTFILNSSVRLFISVIRNSQSVPVLFVHFHGKHVWHRASLPHEPNGHAIGAKSNCAPSSSW